MEPESHITPETQERYDESLSIVEKEAKNVLEIKHQMKDELFPHFKGIIGVFGSYKYVYSNEKLGTEIIDYMASELAKKNPGFLVHYWLLRIHSTQDIETAKQENIFLNDPTNHHNRSLGMSFDFYIYQQFTIHGKIQMRRNLFF